MQYTNSTKCNSIESCSFDDTNNICKPKDCFTNSEGEAACNVDMNHCNRFSEIQLNNKLQDICFDNVRMVKGGNNDIQINDNFYHQEQKILDKCVDKIYNEDNSIKSGNELQNSCIQGCILGNFDGNSEVCVDNTHINPKTFFDGGFCNNITDKDNCDIVQACFWEGNKCFPNLVMIECNAQILNQRSVVLKIIVFGITEDVMSYIMKIQMNQILFLQNLITQHQHYQILLK